MANATPPKRLSLPVASYYWLMIKLMAFDRPLGSTKVIQEYMAYESLEPLYEMRKHFIDAGIDNLTTKEILNAVKDNDSLKNDLRIMAAQKKAA